MLNRPQVWYVVLPVVLIAFLLATTMGMVWHHHAGGTADGCTLCHLAFAPGPPDAGTYGLLPVAMGFTFLNECLVSRCVADEKPPRAPPA
jgi:hypothetical protein